MISLKTRTVYVICWSVHIEVSWFQVPLCLLRLSLVLLSFLEGASLNGAFDNTSGRIAV